MLGRKANMASSILKKPGSQLSQNLSQTSSNRMKNASLRQKANTSLAAHQSNDFLYNSAKKSPAGEVLNSLLESSVKSSYDQRKAYLNSLHRAFTSKKNSGVALESPCDAKIRHASEEKWNDSTNR